MRVTSCVSVCGITQNIEDCRAIIAALCSLPLQTYKSNDVSPAKRLIEPLDVVGALTSATMLTHFVTMQMKITYYWRGLSCCNADILLSLCNSQTSAWVCHRILLHLTQRSYWHHSYYFIRRLKFTFNYQCNLLLFSGVINVFS